jgi:hypothetical protein
MTRPSDSARRYSDSELADILRRASEEEGSNRDPGALSLAEIEAIAADVGIDRAAVRRAAVAIDLPAAPRFAGRVLGGTPRVRLERSFDAALTPERVTRALDAIRRVTRRHGHVEAGPAGAQVSWWTQRTASNLRVTLTGTGETTVVRLEASVGEFAVGAHAGLVTSGGLAGIGATVAAGIGLAAVAPAALIVGGTLGVSYAGARWLVARRVRQAESELARIADALLDVLAAHEEP